MAAVALLVGDPALRRRAAGALAAAGLRVTDAPADGPATIVMSAPRAVQARLDAVRMLRRRFPQAALVVVVPAEVTELHRTIDAGACGVVVAGDLEQRLAVTVQAVRAGMVVVPQRKRPALGRAALSHREKETLELVAAGLRNAEIAARLFVEESTVKSHLKSIFAKLGVNSRNEAAAVALDPASGLGLRVGRPQLGLTA
jgi:DNA-binding NarL/FixJ family response regulator